MSALPVLYQSGYLTISGYNDEISEYALDYPNEEVRASFSKSLLDKYLHTPEKDMKALVDALPRALLLGKVEEALRTLPPFLASIPYDIIEDKEKYFQTVIHLIFRMLGLNCRSEVRLAAGRIDTLVETRNYVYCFEFKLTGTAEEALQQIDRKDYLLPWQGSGKKLFKVGVSFDREKRTIGEWKIGENMLQRT
jgi:hypothetical protein